MSFDVNRWDPRDGEKETHREVVAFRVRVRVLVLAFDVPATDKKRGLKSVESKSFVPERRPVTDQYDRSVSLP